MCYIDTWNRVSRSLERSFVPRIHTFVAYPDQRSTISSVLSDAFSLRRCESYIQDVEARFGCTINRQAVWDNAGASRIVSEERISTMAAIYSVEAAAQYGLRVFEQIAAPNLYRRYFVIGRSDARLRRERVGVRFMASLSSIWSCNKSACFKLPRWLSSRGSR